MADSCIIAVDALGGDAGASVVLPGIAAALDRDPELEVIVCGPADVVEPFAEGRARCTAHVCSEQIGMDEHPARAVRAKKDSSLVVGCRLVAEGRAQGFFSAGSTGACLVAATMVVGRIKGVARPALCTIIPSPVKPVVMCDVGANADCKPAYLVQFAQMAAIYSSHVMEVDHPSVALLNIGTEETKGSAFAQEAYGLLKKKVPEFVGNAEGTDVVAATYDVFVTDGFTGNVCIKTIEGTSKTLFSSIKKIMSKNLATKLAAAVLGGGLRELKRFTSPDTYGGAPILGVKGACLVGHGSSNETAIANGVLTTAKTVRLGVSELIAQTVEDSRQPDTM